MLLGFIRFYIDSGFKELRSMMRFLYICIISMYEYDQKFNGIYILKIVTDLLKISDEF